MAAPVITYGLTSRIARSTLTEVISVTDDVAITSAQITVTAPSLCTIYKEQVTDTYVKITVSIPVTGTITVSATDGDLETSELSANYIVDPLYNPTSTLPYVSLIPYPNGDVLEMSLVNLELNDTYIEYRAMAFDEDGNDISGDVEIFTEEPYSTGTIAADIPDTNISVTNDTIDLGTAAPVSGTAIYFSTVNGFEIDSVQVDTETIYYVVNPSGNTIQLAYMENGDVLDITTIGDGTIDINSTSIIDTSELGTVSISYRVKNSDGLYGNTATRTILIKTNSEIIISPTDDLDISDTEIRHALDPEETRNYGIPFTIGRTTAPNVTGNGVSYPTVQYIRVDGTVPFESSQSMGWYTLTNVANGTNPGDAINLSQLNAAIALNGVPEVFDTQAANNATTAIDTLVSADYRSVKWLVTIEDAVAGTYYSSEILVVKLSSGMDYTEYNMVGDGGPYALTATIVGSNIVLNLTNPLSNIVNVSFIRFKVS